MITSVLYVYRLTVNGSMYISIIVETFIGVSKITENYSVNKGIMFSLTDVIFRYIDMHTFETIKSIETNKKPLF